ncbi:2207_t:CDS:2, partial [Ambispora gerdemannii]
MYQRKEANSSLTIDELSEEYGCDQSTVSKILKAKHEPMKFTQLEDALSIWTYQVFSQNKILTDGLLQLQARKFAELLNISEENLGAKYEANKKAWMTSEIFGHWIKFLNTINHLKCKKILVL